MNNQITIKKSGIAWWVLTDKGFMAFASSKLSSIDAAVLAKEKFCCCGGCAVFFAPDSMALGR